MKPTLCRKEYLQARIAVKGMAAYNIVSNWRLVIGAGSEVWQMQR